MVYKFISFKIKNFQFISFKIKMFKRTQVFRVNSDFLNLIKRLRYRLFGGEIHSVFLISNPSFNTEKLQSIFPNIPNVVWNDEIYTKMHDSLPLLLLKPEHFLYLLLKGFFVEAAYFAPISLSILALQERLGRKRCIWDYQIWTSPSSRNWKSFNVFDTKYKE